MPSSPTSSLRIEKPANGELTNTWGTHLDTDFDLIDAAIAGWTTKALVGNYTLTSANYAADEARSAMLKFTGTGAFTVTVPAVSKRYDVWNACTGILTVTNGSTSVTIQPGEAMSVINDGGANFIRVQPTDFAGAALTSVLSITGLATPTTATQAASKSYVDSVAFTMAGGGLPGQIGNAGKFLATDGSNALWSNTLPTFSGIAGLTSAFPALKRNAANLEVKLGDDSGYAGLTAGALTTLSTLSFASTRALSDVALAADVQAGTSAVKAASPKSLADSAAFGTLTDAATVAWDLPTNGYNTTVTLGGNRAIGAPTGLYDGCAVCLELVQDATGSRVPTWNAIWEWGAALAPTLQTGASKRDLVFGVYRSATSKIHATFRKGV